MELVAAIVILTSSIGLSLLLGAVTVRALIGMMSRKQHAFPPQ